MVHIHSPSPSVHTPRRTSFYCLFYRNLPATFPLKVRDQGFLGRPLMPQRHPSFLLCSALPAPSPCSDSADRVSCNASVNDCPDTRRPRHPIPQLHGSQITPASPLTTGPWGAPRKMRTFLEKRRAGMDETTLLTTQLSRHRENAAMTTGIKQRKAAHRQDVHMFFPGLYPTIACQRSVYAALERN